MHQQCVGRSAGQHHSSKRVHSSHAGQADVQCACRLQGGRGLNPGMWWSSHSRAQPGNSANSSSSSSAKLVGSSAGRSGDSNSSSNATSHSRQLLASLAAAARSKHCTARCGNTASNRHNHQSCLQLTPSAHPHKQQGQGQANSSSSSSKTAHNRSSSRKSSCLHHHRHHSQRCGS